MELATKYGFTDASGELPAGPFSCRESAENSRKFQLKNGVAEGI